MQVSLCTHQHHATVHSFRDFKHDSEKGITYMNWNTDECNWGRFPGTIYEVDIIEDHCIPSLGVMDPISSTQIQLIRLVKTMLKEERFV